MALNYEYLCEPCNCQFEATRKLEDRHRPEPCPKCQALCPKVISATRFNTVFVGSTRAEQLADKYTQLSIEAQNEGFRSKTEIEVAQGMAADRAAKAGTPGKQLIGPVESPVKGAPKPDVKDAAISNILSQRVIKAAYQGDVKKVEAAKEAVKAHETNLREKASSTKLEFKPTNSKKDHATQIKESREKRGRVLS